MVFVTSSRRRTRGALVNGVQTGARPICTGDRGVEVLPGNQRRVDRRQHINPVVCLGLRRIDGFTIAMVPILVLGEIDFLAPTIPIPSDRGNRTVETFYGASLRILEIRSEEHTSELQSLMRISYSVFCL